MNGRQRIDRNDVVARDWQLGISDVQKFTPQEASVDLKVFSSQWLLDSEFPEAGGTEKELIILVVYQCASRWGETLGR
jgi:hypothetical protein